MKAKKLIVFLSIILVIFTLVLAGCDNRSRVKGIREKGKLEEEPTIVVKLNDGTEKNVKLEEYVTGVVAGEMKKDWPVNAFAAQAIIARTFALKHMEENNTNVISGSYEFAQEYKPGNITENIKSAVEKTRGEVALYQDEYIKGWFHSSAGGQTTSAKVGLAYEKEEPPYIKSVKSPDQEAPADIQSWTVSFTNSEIVNTLKAMGKNIGNLQEMSIVNKDKTGRAIDFKFVGSDNTATVKAANFREQLDPKRLKSTKLSSLNKSANGYTFSGSGFGHGVGLSQWGAYAMAKDRKPEEIVSYYFNDIEIAKVYD